MNRKLILSSFVLLVCFVRLGQAQSEPAQVAGKSKNTSDDPKIKETISPGTPSTSAPAAASQKASNRQIMLSADALTEMKAKLAEQQRQIEQLSSALAEQQKVIGNILKAGAVESNPFSDRIPRLGEVASATGMVPSPAAPVMAPPMALQAPAAAGSGDSPLQFHLGSAYFTPVGFMDFTSVSRSTNPGTGIGTNFGSVPFENSQAGSLTETRLSPQNSRLGMRIDALVKGSKVLGYWESDFLGQIGTSANSPNGGLAVSSNPYVFRLRLYWVDVRKNKFEFLAGQSWSMMTPNRKGISAIPGDLFYSQDIDVNYQLGLVWGRIPGIRFLYHPTEKVTFGVSLENSEPYSGGGNGGGGITAPTALAGLLGGQVNNGGSGITAPALFPDVIAKLAFDPSSRFHFEIAGVEIANKIANPASTPAFQTNTKAGVGGSINLNYEVVKNVRLLTNNFWSDGGGRYIFGQAPDFILRSNGGISPVHSGSTVTGIEATVGKTLFYAYYGGVYIARNTALDANGTTRIGYGFSGSSNGQNRAIQEGTLGTNTTVWKDGKYGALNLMFQYSYLQRNPWFVATGQPTDAHVHMGFFNLRYTLPGSAPTLK
jgi:hypothetical protein